MIMKEKVIQCNARLTDVFLIGFGQTIDFYGKEGEDSLGLGYIQNTFWSD